MSARILTPMRPRNNTIALRPPLRQRLRRAAGFFLRWVSIIWRVLSNIRMRPISDSHADAPTQQYDSVEAAAQAAIASGRRIFLAMGVNYLASFIQHPDAA